MDTPNKEHSFTKQLNTTPSYRTESVAIVDNYINLPEDTPVKKRERITRKIAKRLRIQNDIPLIEKYKAKFDSEQSIKDRMF